MKRPVLAATLRQLANSSDPAKLFYNGKLSLQILKEFQENSTVL